MKFLNNYSYKAASYEKNLEIVELTLQKYKQGLCKKTSSNICIILFTDPSKELVNVVSPLLSYYKNDPLSFVYVNKEQEK